MLDTQLAYLAGLIDGEGSVNLWIREGRKDFYFRVLVYNCNEDVIDWCCVNFGGNKYKVGIRKTPKHSQEFQWFTSGQKAHDILVLVLPYLIIKKAKALIAIEAWENRAPTPREDRLKPMSLEVIANRRNYIDKFKALSN